jgi:hypothetical protein
MTGHWDPDHTVDVVHTITPKRHLLETTLSALKVKVRAGFWN